jgi:hypothetical protein
MFYGEQRISQWLTGTQGSKGSSSCAKRFQIYIHKWTATTLSQTTEVIVKRLDRTRRFASILSAGWGINCGYRSPESLVAVMTGACFSCMIRIIW